MLVHALLFYVPSQLGHFLIVEAALGVDVEEVEDGGCEGLAQHSRVIHGIDLLALEVQPPPRKLLPIGQHLERIGVKNKMLVRIAPARKHSPRAKFRELVVPLLYGHVLLGKLGLGLAEAVGHEVAFQHLAKRFVLNHMFYLVSVIAVDETRQC